MLKNKKSKLFFIVLLLFLFMLGADFVLAIEFRAPEINYPYLPFRGVDPPQVFLEKIEKGEEALPLYVKYFYYLFLMIAGLLALGVMVYGGLLYLISAGAPVKMIAAREQITGGILGFVILLSSYLILATINPQLAIFRLPGLEKIEIEPIEIEEMEPRTPVYFQIPTGKIIENAVLNEEAQEKLDSTYQAAEKTAKAAESLYEKSKELHFWVMGTSCGSSECDADCRATGCSGKDYKSDITTAIEETLPAIEDLEEKTMETIIAILPLFNDLSQLQAAGFLMSLKYWEVFTYNDLLSIKHDYEQVNKEVKVTSSPEFPEWENIDLEIDGQIIKDPVTFYLDKSRNEDEIFLAKLILEDFYTVATEPPEGWTPPEGEGQLQWPTIGFSLSGHYCESRTWPRPHHHKGIDILPQIKNVPEPIFAAADGVVSYTGWKSGYGNTIIIEHKELGLITLYAHLIRGSYMVERGNKVKRGQPIALMGSTGWSTGVHLHFEVRDLAGIQCDPLDYLR